MLVTGCKLSGDLVELVNAHFFFGKSNIEYGSVAHPALTISIGLYQTKIGFVATAQRIYSATEFEVHNPAKVSGKYSTKDHPLCTTNHF
jgi:hypothetical protein